MSEKKRPSNALLAAIGAAVVAVVLLGSFLFSSGVLHDRGAGIQFPAGANAPTGSGAAGITMTAQSVAEVEITAANVQQVIASLVRPQEYSYRIENKLYFAGGDSSLFAMRYVSGDTMRMDVVSQGGTVQSTVLRTGTQVYAWDAGESTYYKGVQGDFSDDAASMLPTYEDVLAPEVTLTNVGKQDVAFEPCIRASFEQGGYRCTYFISAASGLLKSATFHQGDTLARQVTISELSLQAPNTGIFTLPNGQTILGE